MNTVLRYIRLRDYSLPGILKEFRPLEDVTSDLNLFIVCKDIIVKRHTLVFFVRSILPFSFLYARSPLRQ